MPEIGAVYTFISQFVDLDERGRGHCPFHPPDRHPSSVVNRRENYWVDFHDMSGGDATAFYRRLRGIDFLQAVGELECFSPATTVLSSTSGAPREADPAQE